MVIDSTLAGFLRYSQRYTEGSAISGAWFLDDLVLGDAPQRNPPARRAVLGCHDAETPADRQNFGKMLLVFGCIGTDLCN